MFKLRRKLIPLLLALFIFNSTYAQSEKIDLSIKNESLRQLIKQIETKKPESRGLASPFPFFRQTQC